MTPFVMVSPLFGGLAQNRFQVSEPMLSLTVPSGWLSLSTLAEPG